MNRYQADLRNVNIVADWVCPHCGAPHFAQCTEAMLWTNAAAGHSQIPSVSPAPHNQPDDHECWKCRKAFVKLEAVR